MHKYEQGNRQGVWQKEIKKQKKTQAESTKKLRIKIRKHIPKWLAKNKKQLH